VALSVVPANDRSKNQISQTKEKIVSVP